MITYDHTYFKLDTQHTSYCFRILESSHLEHLYYGHYLQTASFEDLTPLCEQRVYPLGNSISYDEDHQALNMEDVNQEISVMGKGDLRDSMIGLIYNDGFTSSDFVYQSHLIDDAQPDIAPLPSSYGTCDHLCVTLKDNNSDVLLECHYHVYPDYDIITRYCVLVNNSEETVVINRLLSNQLDFDDDDFIFTTFNGTWAREMERFDHRVQSGHHINASTTGTSSSRANPFVMLSKPWTRENSGECYGMNLVYSGNHYESVEVTSYHKMRFMQGIHPDYTRMIIEPQQRFTTPEAIMSYSDQGFNGLSDHMHRFVNDCIVRGSYQHRERPVLLNSWEANYFNIDERKLVRLARRARFIGADLFVMDDGWFGKRNDDTSSLGDWSVNEKKLPNGLEGLVDKINRLGLDFGLWVEPEMVNENSDLYRAHPDWALKHPMHAHAQGRHQMVLDLCNPEVVNYLFDAMSNVFSTANITYVKWDMNRNISDYFSPYLDAEHQGEVAHRYVLGLYQLMSRLTRAFPNILFEGCASGGNRFDLGILAYFPQIWASDDTDAYYRAQAQTNYSYGYPLSTIAAHVSSSPNHQTLRRAALETRFGVASFGVLGYELQLIDQPVEDLMTLRNQVELYKSYRRIFQYGRFYRHNQRLINWTVVSKDQSIAIGMIMQSLNRANDPYHKYYADGLAEDQRYLISNRHLKHNIQAMGDLINTSSPVHIRQGSLTHQLLARIMKLEGEDDTATTTGGILMHNGFKLKPAYGGTGFNDDVRLFTDFDSRIYFIEALDDEEIAE